MLITLTLKRRPTSVRPASGWFIPGHDPSAWLEEVTRWPVPSDQLRFYVVGSSASSEAAGVLVVPGPEMSLPSGSRAQPCGELRRGFYLPTDADLFPQMSADEFASQCRYPVMLFHPAFGLTGFEANAA